MKCYRKYYIEFGGIANTAVRVHVYVSINKTKMLHEFLKVANEIACNFLQCLNERSLKIALSPLVSWVCIYNSYSHFVITMS